MNAPKRIQRQRTKGWRMPENTVYVGRPGRWGNAYRLSNAPLGHPNPRQWLVDAHREWLRWCGPIKAAEIRTYLRGKNLACWCKPGDPCHADVLLAIANPAADHPHTDPGDGRTECERCGKYIWPAIHSCKGVPVTARAIARADSNGGLL